MLACIIEITNILSIQSLCEILLNLLLIYLLPHLSVVHTDVIHEYFCKVEAFGHQNRPHVMQVNINHLPNSNLIKNIIQIQLHLSFS